MNPADPRVLLALAELREQYAHELPGLVATLIAAVARLRVDHDPDAAAQAKAQSHRLRGTAGSYGYHDMSEAAARLEQALAPPLSLADIEDALDAVRAAIPLVES